MTIHDELAATRAEMGHCSTPAARLRTMLIRDGHFVGHKHPFEGGWASWLAKTNVIEVYDDGTICCPGMLYAHLPWRPRKRDCTLPYFFAR